MFKLKDYQETTLNAFSRWLESLAQAQQQSAVATAALESVEQDVPDDIRNYPKTAWQRLAKAEGTAQTAGEYVSRSDEAGRPIPHVCFKVPTGGGKTLLAAAALERLNRQTGLTLWITPTRAIYQQTRAALRNREHPYREMLERASGGRVRLLEKDDLFTGADVVNYLCVMLLMLPATNRQKGREFLRMFRDSGRYPTLFPDSDDVLGDARLLNDHPDLERTGADGPVKHSLFNVFKMLRPVVVLDEAHKAYGASNAGANQEFVRSVNRLDPSLVIELSATPNRGISNLLVDITGVELKNEEMIKLPVQVNSITNTEWQHTLAQAHDELERLGTDAESLQHNEGRYIRPIAVVRVERTGKDQRDGERVHAEDVREYLVRTLGVPREAVVVKSAELDELAGIDLLSELSPVRWIITRAALMEGWDCSFAYLLVMLDNTTAQRAITQLVGRVMRQPHARRTGVERLDQCYVYCWNTSVGEAVTQVRNGLESEGLTGLGGEVVTVQTEDWMRVTVNRREKFRGDNIFLPMVLHQDGKDWIELDYQRHILPAIDWEALNLPDQQDSMPDRARLQTATVDVGTTPTVFHADQELFIDKTLRISWFARRLSDIVPNPWQAARLSEEMVEKWRESDSNDDDIHDRRSYLAWRLREHVTGAVDLQAQQVFQQKLKDGEIVFDLQASRPNFRMKESYEIPIHRLDSPLTKYGQQVQLSLFEPVFDREFDSDLERNFALYLDEQKALRWWHRVAVRQRGDYYLRGWRQERIWPDFVAMAGRNGAQPHVLVFETKGEHLRGNPDTEYKQKVLETLQNAFNCGSMTIKDGPAKGTFRLVFNQNEFSETMAGLENVYTT